MILSLLYSYQIRMESTIKPGGCHLVRPIGAVVGSRGDCMYVGNSSAMY